MMSQQRSRPMRFLAASLLAGLALAASAGSATAVEPFSADYNANYMGMTAKGRMSLASQGGNRWKYSLEVNGAGARLVQSTVFENRDGQWRPLSSEDLQRGEGGLAAMLVKSRQVNATYDWNRGQASWSGDIKPERAGPVKLQAGDVDGMLMNLALVRDFQAGRPTSYRLVEDGRVRKQEFKRAGTEAITVAGKPRQATKLVWNGDNRSITAWVVDGLPVPARILQQRGGRDHIDLRLQSLK